jgi:ligand-binding sensor domain-containing protein/two-component sensor histidine kinase
MYKYILSITLLLSLDTTLFAQQQMGQYMAYGPEAKYFSNLNFTVHQSKQGFLWIGTQNGIVRFDGRRYKNFFSDPINANSPSDNSVVDIVEDKNGDLWFCGFYHGLTKYSTGTTTFKKYNKPTADNFSFYGIYDGLKDKENNLWFATAGRGLAKYIYGKDSFELFYPEPDKCKDGSVRGENYVTGICEDKFDTHLLWLTSFKGLFSFNKETNRFTFYPSGVVSAPFSGEVQLNNCEADNKGNLWLPSWGGGLLYFNTITKKYDPQKRKAFPKIINHVKLINDSILLAACFDEGLYQLNINNNIFTNITPPRNPADSSAKNTNIQKISVTKDAGVFIGGNYYVYQLHPSFSRLKKNIFFEDDNPENDILLESITWDERNHQYWISTAYASGLYTLKEKETIAKKITAAEIPVQKYKVFKTLVKDSLQRIWVTSSYAGIFLWNDLKKIFEKPLPGIISLADSLLQSVISLQTDSAGNIWMLTKTAFIYFDVIQNNIEVFAINWGSNYKGSKKLSPAYIRMDSGGSPWLITQNGLFVCNRKEKKVRHIFDTEIAATKFSYNSFWGGAFDKQDNLWLTSPNGIQVYSTKKNEVISNFSIADGLPSMITTGIAVDKEDRIWVNTAAGLAMYDQQKNIWRSFNRFDGMNRDYLDGNIFITSNNKIVIDQSSGFLMKDINDIVSSAAIPFLQITSLTINDKPFFNLLHSLNNKTLELSFDQNNISIEFAAMDWLYPFKTNYLVKIEGLQPASTWTPNPDARINLAGLAPGKYVVHIKAINSSGVWSNEILLPVIIKAPFWKTWWFITACILIVLGILYWLYRYRINQLQRMQLMRNNISRNLHDDIGSSLSNINILTELAKRNAANPEKSNEYLNKVGEDIQRISESLGDIVWNINPKYDDLENLFIRMKRYAADMLDGKDISYEIEFPEKLTDVKLEMGKRKDLYFIFKEAVNNLIKYSGATHASIVLTIQQKRLTLLIKDNGKGFNPATVVMGNGLQNMQHRAGIWNATLKIESRKGAGTSIFLQMAVT